MAKAMESSFQQCSMDRAEARGSSTGSPGFTQRNAGPLTHAKKNGFFADGWAAGAAPEQTERTGHVSLSRLLRHKGLLLTTTVLPSGQSQRYPSSQGGEWLGASTGDDRPRFERVGLAPILPDWSGEHGADGPADNLQRRGQDRRTKSFAAHRRGGSVR